MFIKKTIVFIFTMLTVFALITVDTAYSDMLRKDSLITPQIKKVEDRLIEFSILGKSVYLDIQEIEKIYAEIKSDVKNRFNENIPEINIHQFPAQKV